MSRLAALAAAFVFLVCAAPTVSAQESGPAAIVAAYANALNTHDKQAALSLFDQYGSATDPQGHHYEGAEALGQFLHNTGFDDPSSQVTTQNVHVVANRAVWTYTCTCSNNRPTEVRLVTNHDRITVFAILPPPAAATRAASAATPGPFAVAMFLLIALGAGAASTYVLRRPRAIAAATPRHTEGRLLAALAQARPRDQVLLLDADSNRRD